MIIRTKSFKRAQTDEDSEQYDNDERAVSASSQQPFKNTGSSGARTNYTFVNAGSVDKMGEQRYDKKRSGNPNIIPERVVSLPTDDFNLTGVDLGKKTSSIFDDLAVADRSKPYSDSYRSYLTLEEQAILGALTAQDDNDPVTKVMRAVRKEMANKEHQNLMDNEALRHEKYGDSDDFVTPYELTKEDVANMIFRYPKAYTSILKQPSGTVNFSATGDEILAAKRAAEEQIEKNNKILEKKKKETYSEAEDGVEVSPIDVYTNTFMDGWFGAGAEHGRNLLIEALTSSDEGKPVIPIKHALTTKEFVDEFKEILDNELSSRTPEEIAKAVLPKFMEGLYGYTTQEDGTRKFDNVSRWKSPSVQGAAYRKMQNKYSNRAADRASGMLSPVVDQIDDLLSDLEYDPADPGSLQAASDILVSLGMPEDDAASVVNYLIKFREQASKEKSMAGHKKVSTLGGSSEVYSPEPYEALSAGGDEGSAQMRFTKKLIDIISDAIYSPSDDDSNPGSKGFKDHYTEYSTPDGEKTSKLSNSDILDYLVEMSKYRAKGYLDSLSKEQRAQLDSKAADARFGGDAGKLEGRTSEEWDADMYGYRGLDMLGRAIPYLSEIFVNGDHTNTESPNYGAWETINSHDIMNLVRSVKPEGFRSFDEWLNAQLKKGVTKDELADSLYKQVYNKIIERSIKRRSESTGQIRADYKKGIKDKLNSFYGGDYRAPVDWDKSSWDDKGIQATFKELQDLGILGMDYDETEVPPIFDKGGNPIDFWMYDPDLESILNNADKFPIEFITGLKNNSPNAEALFNLLYNNAPGEGSIIDNKRLMDQFNRAFMKLYYPEFKKTPEGEIELVNGAPSVLGYKERHIPNISYADRADFAKHNMLSLGRPVPRFSDTPVNRAAVRRYSASRSEGKPSIRPNRLSSLIQALSTVMDAREASSAAFELNKLKNKGVVKNEMIRAILGDDFVLPTSSDADSDYKIARARADDLEEQAAKAMGFVERDEEYQEKALRDSMANTKVDAGIGKNEGADISDIIQNKEEVQSRIAERLKREVSDMLNTLKLKVKDSDDTDRMIVGRVLEGLNTPRKFNSNYALPEFDKLDEEKRTAYNNIVEEIIKRLVNGGVLTKGELPTRDIQDEATQELFSK